MHCVVSHFIQAIFTNKCQGLRYNESRSYLILFTRFSSFARIAHHLYTMYCTECRAGALSVRHLCSAVLLFFCVPRCNDILDTHIYKKCNAHFSFGYTMSHLNGVERFLFSLLFQRHSFHITPLLLLGFVCFPAPFREYFSFVAHTINMQPATLGIATYKTSEHITRCRCEALCWHNLHSNGYNKEQLVIILSSHFSLIVWMCLVVMHECFVFVGYSFPFVLVCLNAFQHLHCNFHENFSAFRRVAPDAHRIHIQIHARIFLSHTTYVFGFLYLTATESARGEGGGGEREQESSNRN